MVLIGGLMDISAQELAIKKNNLYRDSYRITIKWLVRMLVVTAILSITLMWMTLATKQSDYYAAVTDGEVVPLHALSEPIVSNDFIVRWSALTVRKLFNLQFDSYQQQLGSIRDRFTNNGWQKLQSALKSSGLISNLVNNKLIMSAVVSNSPVILGQLIIGGRMTWRVQMELLVTFTSANEQRQQKLIATMNVRRVATLNVAQGIQISDFATSTPE